MVTSESSRKRLPEFGPRWTISRAEPGGSASMADSTSADRAGVVPVPVVVVGSYDSRPEMEMVDVVSAAPSGSRPPRSAVPQLEQNRAEAGFWLPHLGHGVGPAMFTASWRGTPDGLCPAYGSGANPPPEVEGTDGKPMRGSPEGSTDAP